MPFYWKAAPNQTEKAVVGKVSPQLSTAVKEHGLNIDGYIHNIDTSAVQHTRKRHGIPQREERRGQLAVTDDDFKNIPQIIYNPDFVAFGAKNNKGLDLIIYGKNMPDGSSVYVEEIRTGKKTLTTNSLRKYKTGVNPSSFAKRISNAHGDTGTISIVGKEDFVKPDLCLQQPNSYDAQDTLRPIDLTDKMGALGSKTNKEIADSIEKELNSLIGEQLNTASAPLQIQITEGNKPHIKNANVPLNRGQRKRHAAALQSLRDIVQIARRTDRDGRVDLSHNKGKTLRHKQNVEEYVYFSAPVQINTENGPIFYDVELHTERIKGQDPNVLDLYHVRVKRNLPNAGLTALRGDDNSIGNNGEIVKPENLRQDDSVLREKSKSEGYKKVKENPLKGTWEGKDDMPVTMSPDDLRTYIINRGAAIKDPKTGDIVVQGAD